MIYKIITNKLNPMSLKYGQVRAVKPNQAIVYFDGHGNRKLNPDIARAFLGNQFSEFKALLGHSIHVIKDRSGRIENIKVID